MRNRRAIGFSLALMSLTGGCGGPAKPESSPLPKAEPAPWSVTMLDPTEPTPAYLSNGMIGIRIGRDGTFDGLALFDIAEYEKSGEEKILRSGIPFQLGWAPAEGWTAGRKPEARFWDLKTVTEYSQALEFKTGVLHTRWKAQVGSRGVAAVQVSPPSKNGSSAGTPQANRSTLSAMRMRVTPEPS